MPLARGGSAARAAVERERVQAASDDHHSDDSDNELRLPKYGDIDPKYLNQPVDNQSAQLQLKPHIADLSGIVNQLDKACEALESVAADLATVLSSTMDNDQDNHADDQVPQDPDQIKQLDLEFRSLLDSIQETKIMQDSLNLTRNDLLQSHVINDLHNAYHEPCQRKLEEYRNQTPRQKYLNNEKYKSFRSLIWENLHKDQPVPDVKKFLPRGKILYLNSFAFAFVMNDLHLISTEQGDEEDDDDEIDIAQSHDFKCPLTLKILEQPMTSYVAFFFGSAIRQYLNSSTKDCPVSGCNKRLNLKDLEMDKTLSKRVEAFKRRQQQQQRVGLNQSGSMMVGGGSRTQYETISDQEDDE
ncbi:hypothetical protein OIO90_001197 [Microbotryomycetes sp. JL221]|nr:hypothetical protein OIO90_001197 [Microbotryomycetes sp. JL221]